MFLAVQSYSQFHQHESRKRSSVSIINLSIVRELGARTRSDHVARVAVPWRRNGHHAVTEQMTPCPAWE